jgi:CRP-like cAMP-binding protein
MQRIVKHTKTGHYPQLHNLGSASLYFDEILSLKHIKLFEDFSNDEIEALCRYMTCYAASTGSRVLTEGHEGDFLLLVLTGKVAVLKRNEFGVSYYLGVAEPGTMLGEISLINGTPYFASCDAIVPTDFAVLSRASLNLVLAQIPRLGNKLLFILLQLMATRLCDSSRQSFRSNLYSYV